MPAPDWLAQASRGKFSTGGSLDGGTDLRQQIVEAIEDRFETILTANGYRTNLGQHVFEWRSTLLTDDELPGLVWRDLDESGDISIGEWEHGMGLEIDLHVFSETDAMAGLREAIADVIQAVGQDTTFGGLTQDVTPAGRDFIRITRNDGRYASCMLAMVVTYLSDRWLLSG